MLFLFFCFIISVFSYDQKWEENMGELKWNSFDQALEEAKRRQLPILGFFIGLDCKLCPNYLRMFSAYPKFKEMAKRFVLAAVDETDPFYNMEPLAHEQYTPKFAFYDNNGKMLDYDNEDEFPNQKYFYSNIESILSVMEDVDDYIYEKKHEL